MLLDIFVKELIDAGGSGGGYEVLCSGLGPVFKSENPVRWGMNLRTPTTT